MLLSHYTKERPKGKHLTIVERGQIEAYRKQGLSHRGIAALIGCCVKTIQRELKRGQVELLNSDYTVRTVYDAEFAQRDYESKQRRKQGVLAIGKRRDIAEAIERLIIEEHDSPYAAWTMLSKKEPLPFCLRTLYRYIKHEVFLRLSPKHLPYAKGSRREALSFQRIRKLGGRSIEQRDNPINRREEGGHWEMDTVVSGRGGTACLLVLTERVSRKEIIRKLPEKKAADVITALTQLKSEWGDAFSSHFKTITSDNGAEFMDAQRVEKMGITYFYAHSYASYERGSNENNNRLIRRFIPKGSDISKYSKAFIQKVEDFMNTYPRKIFHGQSANDVYEQIFA